MILNHCQRAKNLEIRKMRSAIKQNVSIKPRRRIRSNSFVITSNQKNIYRHHFTWYNSVNRKNEYWCVLHARTGEVEPSNYRVDIIHLLTLANFHKVVITFISRIWIWFSFAVWLPQKLFNFVYLLHTFSDWLFVFCALWHVLSL